MPRRKPFNVVRKIHDQSSLASLTEKQEAELMVWFTRENLTYGQARQRLQERFGVKVSKTALHAFWHRYCADATGEHSPTTGAAHKQAHRSSALDSLSPQQLEELKSWFTVENLDYKQAVDRVGQRFGVKVGWHAIRNYWHRVIGPLLLSQSGGNAQAAGATSVEIIFKRGAEIIARTSKVLPVKTEPPQNPA